MKNVFVSSIRDEGDKVFELAKEYHLGVEILGFVEPFMINDFASKVRATKEKISHIEQCSLHGPFIDLSPASKDPEILNVVKTRFLKAYETAKIFNAQHLIFHAGYIPKAYFPQNWLDNSIEFWKRFISDIDQDIEIHIENVCEDDYFLISELIRAVNSPIFSACLDIGHVNVNSSKTLESWIKGLNNDIRYVHLHNNDGVSDNHYGLCRGQINITETLKLLQIYAPDAIWTLETKLDETEQSIMWLEQQGFVSRGPNRG